MFLLILQRYLFVCLSSKFRTSCFNAFCCALFVLAVPLLISFISSYSETYFVVFLLFSFCIWQQGAAHATLFLLPHGIHDPGLWAYATLINPQAAEDIKADLFVREMQTQTPHCNTQRGYIFWWEYQHYDTLTFKTRAPHWAPTPPPSSKLRRRQPPKWGSARSGAEDTWSKPKWHHTQKSGKTPGAKTTPPPSQTGRGGGKHPRRVGSPLHVSTRHKL